MRRAAIWLLTIGTATIVAQEQSQTPVFRTGTQLVTVDVSVLRRNAPVVGLTASDFEILDDGVPQRVVLLEPDTVPVDVSLVFDQTYFAQARIGSTFQTDLARIVALLRPIDRLRVISFAADVREVSPMQGTHGWNANEVPDMRPSPAVAPLQRAGRLDSRSIDFMQDPALRRWSLFDALVMALARPAEMGRRHLIVAFCVGMDTASVMNDGAMLEMIAARADGLLHIGLWNRRVMGQTREGVAGQYAREAVTAAALATGGSVHDVANTVSAFKSILEDIRRSYVLQYTATGVALGGWHTIVVKTPRFPNYTVRARRGYLGR
jgi:VWFA-related protein